MPVVRRPLHKYLVTKPCLNFDHASRISTYPCMYSVGCRYTNQKLFLGFLKAFSEDPISGRSNHFYNYNLSKNQNALLFHQEIMHHNKSSVQSQKQTNSRTSRNFESMWVFFIPLYYFVYFSCNIFFSTQFSFYCSLL